MAKRWLGLALLVMLLASSVAHAQDSAARTLTYGETVSGEVTAADPRHLWIFEGQSRTLIRATLRRISGGPEFRPRLRLLDTAGDMLAEGQPISAGGQIYDDTQVLQWEEGLPQDGSYTLEVTADLPAEPRGDNPTRYTLTLERVGERRANTYTPYTPLSEIGSAPLSGLDQGDLNAADSNPARIDIYNADRVTPDIERDSRNGNRNLIFLTEGDARVDVLNNPRVVSGAVQTIAFTDDGIAFQPIDEMGAGWFLTDQPFIELVVPSDRLIQVRLDNGQQILTDFVNIASIEARENLVVVHTWSGQRLVLTGTTFTLLARRQGAAAEPVYQICIDGTLQNDACSGLYVVTDAVGWDTLAIVPSDEEGDARHLRVLYGADARLISDDVRVELYDRADDPITPFDERWISDLRLPSDDPGTSALETLPLTLDRRGMGDVRLEGEQLSVLPLDGRSITEALSDVAALLVEDRAVQVTRRNGTYRLSLPDGTEIDTPSALDGASGALPNESGFVPVGLNNLGSNLLETCPCLSGILENRPVNPVNGNIVYSVTDLSIPSHTLALEFTRTYNSQAGILTPAYMREAPGGYAFGQLGLGWRHTYQIELDITHAPRNVVRLIRPDGAQFVLTRDDADRDQDGDRSEFRSPYAPLWSVTRLSGATGEWLAARVGGERYWFDRAGRLLRITNALGHALTFSPAPREAVSDPSLPSGISGGMIVSEPYGRLLQWYSGADGSIRVLRDQSARQITYRYSGDTLDAVETISDQQTAAYEYDAVGRMLSYNDRFSPYQPQGLFTYDARGRAEQFSENPASPQPREYRYSYENGSTSQRVIVSGAERVTTWTYDAEFLITGQTLPLPEFSYQFTYSNSLLVGVRRPDNTFVRVEYTPDGLLRTIRDARYGGTDTGVYRIEYTPVGMPARVTLPNGGEELYAYDASNPYLLVERRRRVNSSSRPDYETTGYSYDTWGRVAAITRYNYDGTPLRVDQYRYDAFGYLSAAIRGSADGALTHSVRFGYDLIGQLLEVVDGRGRSYRFSWDAYGKLTRLDAPENLTQFYTYDERGRVTSLRITSADDSTGSAGTVTQFTYDAFGNITSQTDAMGGRTLYTYDEAGNLISMVDPLDRRFTYEYSPLDELLRAVDPAGRATTYAVVLEGPPENRVLVRSVTDAAGRTTRYTYDVVGRLVRVQVTDRTTSQSYVLDYNSVGELTRVTDQNELGGRTLEIQYDLLGRVTANAIGAIGSSESFQYTYTYDALGNLTRVTDPGRLEARADNGERVQVNRTTEYTYDVFGNVLSVSRGGFGLRSNGQPLPVPPSTTQYTYDENSNITAITDPDGRVTTYTYDSLNRLNAVIGPDGQRTGYTYDLRGNLIAIVDPREVTRSAVYDDQNRLISVTNQQTNTTYAYEYDALGRITVATDEARIRTSYTYDLAGNLIATARSRAETYYDYDVVGRLTSITDALGRTTSFTYTPYNTLDRIIDAQGNERTYRWRNGVLAEFIDFDGQNYEYNTESDPFGRLTQIRDLNTGEGTQPANTFFQYDGSGNITRVRRGVSDGDAAITTQYSYDIYGRLVSYAAADGSAVLLDYTLGGLLTRVTYVNDPDSASDDYVVTYDYAPDTTWISRITYGANTDEPYSESWDYDANGNITAYSDPAGIVTEYTYYADNRIQTMTQAAGTDQQRVFTYTYDAGNLTQVIDPLGGVVQYRYDPATGLLRRVILDAESETPAEYSFVYDSVGNLLSVVYPSGQGAVEINGETSDAAFVTMTYDSLNRRVRYTDALGSVWAYTYDTFGNVTSISDPLGSTISYEYDSQYRLVRVTYPNQAVVTISYVQGANGNLIVTVTGAQTQERGVGDPAINPREQIIYEFDVAGNLVRIDEDNGRQTTLLVYENGLLVRRCTASQTTTADSCPPGSGTAYDYDDHGRLIRTAYPDGAVIEREYDQRGLLLTVTMPDGTLTYEYDDLGRLTRARAQGITTAYVYDLMDNVIEREVDGETITYVYDSQYRPIDVSYDSHGVTFTYDPNGWRTTMTRSNGVVTTYGYDAVGRVTEVRHQRGEEAPLAQHSYTYQYDAVGNVLRIARRDGWDVIYSYDPLHRIIDERWPDAENNTRYALGIRYDDAGNRVEEIRQDLRTLFLYNDPAVISNDQNQLNGEIRGYIPEQILLQSGVPLLIALLALAAWLLRKRPRWLLHGAVTMLGLLTLTSFQGQPTNQQVPQVIYTYNRDGSLLAITYLDVTNPRQPVPLGQVEFSYDGENRLVRVRGEQIDFTTRDADGNPTVFPVDTTYSYDAFSRLTEWSTGEDQRYRFAYDGATMVQASDDAGQQTRYFAPFPNERLLLLTPDGEAHWLLNDALGTPRGTTDANGDLSDVLGAQVLEVNASGELIDPAGVGLPELDLPQPLLAGQLYDPSMAYYVLGLRTYDPRLGRFLQRDPVRHDTAANTYVYARNRPTVLIDPSGTTPEAAFDATGVNQMPARLLPPAAPRPLLPDIPQPPSTSGVQADEMVRALVLMARTRYALNETVAAVDPLLLDLYVYTLRPIEPQTLDWASQPVLQGLTQFTPGAGWVPLPVPTPQTNPAPLALLEDIQPQIAQAFTRPGNWCAPPVLPRPLLPAIPLPQVLPGQRQEESALVSQIMRIPLMGSVDAELTYLLGVAVLPTLDAPAVQVTTPAPEVLPVIPSLLQALQGTQYQQRLPVLPQGVPVPPLEVSDPPDTITAP